MLVVVKRVLDRGLGAVGCHSYYKDRFNRNRGKEIQFVTDLKKHIIGLVFYPGMTSLDMVGPHQVFSARPGVELHRIWKTLLPIKTDDGLVILPDTTFENCPPFTVDFPVSCLHGKAKCIACNVLVGIGTDAEHNIITGKTFVF